MSENLGRYDIDVPSSSSPDEELFEAAKNGKLDDFKKLCDEKKLNPLKLTNKPDLNFPIHEAASNDQVDIIAEILKRDGRNEMLESKNVYGQTPLHVAAMYNRTKTIEFLIDKGANPNSKDKNESTALQLSIEMQKTYSWRTLLKKDGVDFQTENAKGNTLLHTAAENGSADLCKVLVKEKNINIKKLNKDKEHALFGVLRTLKGESTKEMLCYLFDKCIDPEDREKILTKENAKGETLLNVARQYGNKEVIKYLKQLIEEIDMSALIVDKNKKFNQVKLFVCGSENVGKTTLIKSLESKDALLFRTHNDGGVHDPTPGIDIKMCDFPFAGIFSVWDFAGQPEFYLTHPLFMDAHNAITILVYKNVAEERQQSTFIITKIMEWLRFLKASTDETKPSQKKPTIILVGTHSDEVDRQRAVKQGEFLVKHLKEKFSKWLNILDEVIVVDARQPYDKKTEGMGLLRTTLRDQRNSYLEAKEIPSMCFDILSGLANCKNPFPVKTWREYVQYVKDEIIPDIGENESVLQNATEYLQNIGEICILKVPQIQAAASEDPASPSVELDDLRQSRIVLRPQWLCRNIFGRLLAPDCFSHRLVSVDPSKDTYSKEQMHKAFSGVLNGVEKLIELLVILELCYEIEGEVLIPCKLVSDMPSDVWKVDATTVSYGRRICCKNTEIDGFPKSFFPKIHTSLAIYLRKTGGDVVRWKNGLKGSLDGVDFIIQMTPELQAVQIVVQIILDDTYCHIRKMPHQKCLKKCHRALLRLTQHVNFIKDETCPGTETIFRFLSSKSLQGCRDPCAIKHTYSIEDLLDAEEKKQGLVSTHDIQDYVHQILIPGSSNEVLDKLGEKSNVKWIPTDILAAVAEKLDEKLEDMHDYRAFSAVIDLEQKGRSLEGNCESITIALLNEWCEKKDSTIQSLREILQKKPIVDRLSKDRGDVARILNGIFPINSVPQSMHINMSE